VNGGNGPSGPFYVPMPFRPCERLLFRINKLLFSEKKIVNKLFRIQQVLNPGLLVRAANEHHCIAHTLEIRAEHLIESTA
jgi:hypothetical protein